MCTIIRTTVILAALALVFAPHLAGAQQIESPVMCDEGVIAEPIPLAYGDHTVGCEIDPIGDADRFTFDAVAGDLPRIIVNADQSAMDPRLEIRDPVGVLLHDSFCSGFCTFTVEPPDFNISPLVSLATGTYTLIISDAGADETGPYLLQLELLLPVMPREEIFYDSPVTDTIDPDTDMDFFEFQGVAGDEIRFIVNADNNAMDPRLEIWDPDGDKLEDVFCVNFCSFTRETSEFALMASATLPKTGVYQVALSEAGVNEMGEYTINVQCLFGSCDPEPPEALPAETVGTIESDTDMDAYTWDGVAGTQIRVLVNGDSDAMDPRLEIWDPDGVKLEDASCSGFCTFTRETSEFASPSATLPKTGSYRLLVSDAGVNETGAYEISIHCLLGSCDSDQDTVADPPLPPAILYGSSLTDQIENDTDMDFFVFYGTSGDIVRLAVNATLDAMDPRLELWAPDGTKLHDGGCVNFCSFTLDPDEYSILPSATLPQTGNYRIAISDSGANESGTYLIGLECIFGTCVNDPGPLPTTGDNCVDVPNAPPFDCDTDMNGFGNACDGDFNDDGPVDFVDIPLFTADLNTGSDGGSGTDMNCDGAVDFADVPKFVDQLAAGRPGPGLSCAPAGTCP